MRTVLKMMILLLGSLLLATGLIEHADVQSAENWQLPAGFVYLDSVAPTIVQDIRYAGQKNFVGRPVKGYQTGRCILTEKAAYALAKVQADLALRGLSLKVYDCYRPQQAVDAFAAWAQDITDNKMKSLFYPQVEKTDLFKEGYIAYKSGHSRGSTVDLTIIPLKGPSAKRKAQHKNENDCRYPDAFPFQDDSIDMGTAFDCFDVHSQTRSTAISATARLHRQHLKEVMEKYGFKNLPQEWWHYTLVDEPYPDRYFDFPIR